MGMPTGEELEKVLVGAIIGYTVLIAFVILLGITTIVGLVYLAFHLQLGWH